MKLRALIATVSRCGEKHAKRLSWWQCISMALVTVGMRWQVNS